MADDLADYPIVVLENDYPEQVGKLGLFDYLMPVGSTGMVFVAAIPGRLYPWGAKFTELVRKAADLTAAATLVQMGLIRGETFAFMRNALRLTIAEVAGIYGVLEATVQGWEDNSIPIPRLTWGCFSNRVMVASGRTIPAHTAVCPSFRPRKIRVFPNIPIPTEPQPTSPPCHPSVPLVGPDCGPMGPPLC